MRDIESTRVNLPAQFHRAEVFVSPNGKSALVEAFDGGHLRQKILDDTRTMTIRIISRLHIESRKETMQNVLESARTELTKVQCELEITELELERKGKFGNHSATAMHRLGLMRRLEPLFPVSYDRAESELEKLQREVDIALLDLDGEDEFEFDDHEGKFGGLVHRLEPFVPTSNDEPAFGEEDDGNGLRNGLGDGLEESKTTNMPDDDDAAKVDTAKDGDESTNVRALPRNN